jgi:hypothetical protein
MYNVVMSGKVPKDPSYCTWCIDEATTGPCDDHRGPDGTAVPYTGEDAYEPSAYVLDVMSRRWRGWHGTSRIWECFGFDPRTGYWMRSIDGGPVEQTNISYRAIGNTWFPVNLTLGAWQLASSIVSLGRMPKAGEVMADVERASRTLHDLGLLSEDGILSEAGRQVATSPFVDDPGP